MRSERFCFLGMALLLGLSSVVSCQNGKNGKGSDATDSVAAVVDTDSVHIVMGDSLAQVDVRLIYPTEKTVWADSVTRWMGSLLKGLEESVNGESATPENDRQADEEELNAQADRSCRSIVGCLRAIAENERKELLASGFEDRRPTYLCMMETTPLCRTAEYVTYKSMHYSYMGGAHGSTTEEYVTFDLHDGHRLTATLKPSSTAKIQKLLRQGLLRYFEANIDQAEKENLSEKNLDQFLFADQVKDSIPLPQQMPVLTPKGLLFVYQQYEIAPYAAGILTFTVPYADIEPYMTDEANRLH